MGLKGVIAAVLCLSLISGPVQADAVTDYYEQMRDYFLPTHFIPIVIPRGDQIGNVYDIRTLQFVAAGKMCFPTLQLPAAVDTVLGTFKGSGSLSGGLAIGIKNIASVDANLGKNASTTIAFSDAKIISVPSLTMVAAFDAAACPFLQAQIDATRNGTTITAEQGRLVIGEVLLAKRSVTFTYTSQAEAQAALSNWTHWIQAFSVDASAKIQGGNQNSVVVTTTDVLPLAVRPAFVPDKFSGTTLGPGPQTFHGVQWKRFDPDSLLGQQYLTRFSTDLTNSLPSVANLKGF